MNLKSGIIPLGPDRFVEVFTVDDGFDLWLVDKGNREYVGKSADLKDARTMIAETIGDR